MKARIATRLSWLLAILSIPVFAIPLHADETASPDPNGARYLEFQLIGENPLEFKAFEAIPEDSPLAKQILLDAISTFEKRYGYMPKLAFMGPGEEMRLLSENVTDDLRAEHTEVDAPVILDMREWFKSNQLLPYDIQEEVQQRSQHLHPSRQSTLDRKPTFGEFVWGSLNGFTLAIMSGWLWFIKTDNYEAALNIGILLTFERLAHFTFRPMIDHIKRIPDGALARRIKHLVPWMVASSVWKVLFDVCIGMVMVHLPRAIPWALQVYEGDAWTINFSDASMTTFVLWNLFIQSVLHTIADPFSIARIYNEGWGTISRRVTNWISYIKPYFTNSLTLLRIPSAAGALWVVSTANVVTAALIGVGVLTLVMPWSNVFQFFGGGEVVIGADLRPKYIRRKHSFGIRYVIEEPDPNVAPGRYVKIDSFFGYRPIFENGNQALKFDNKYFVVEMDDIHITRHEEDGDVVVSNRRRYRRLVNSLVFRGQEKAYHIVDGKIQATIEGKNYTLDIPLKQVVTDAFISSHNNRLRQTQALSLEDEKLIDALVALDDLRFKEVRSVKLKNNKTALLIEVEGLKIYHRFGYHFLKDQHGKFVRLPNKALDFVDYMAAVNESMGRYLKRIVTDGNIWQRIKRHSRMVTNAIWQWLDSAWHLPKHLLGKFKKTDCQTPR